MAVRMWISPEHAEVAPDDDNDDRNDEYNEVGSDGAAMLRWLPSLSVRAALHHDQEVRVGRFDGAWTSTLWVELTWPLGGG
jgi:hypothetical protein